MATAPKADGTNHADGDLLLGDLVTPTPFPGRSNSSGETSMSGQPGMEKFPIVGVEVAAGSSEAGSCVEPAESSESSSDSGSSDTDVSPLDTHLRR